MPVVDYAKPAAPSPRPKRLWLITFAQFATIAVCLFISYPAIHEAHWLEQAHHYNLDPPIIQEVESGQSARVAVATAAWVVAGVGWISIYFYRWRLRTKRASVALDRPSV